MSPTPPSQRESTVGLRSPFTLQSVRVATGMDEEGMLVFADGRLVAVLVRLSEFHEGLAGDWFLETGYGPLDGPDHATFPDFPAGLAWIDRRLDEASRPR